MSESRDFATQIRIEAERKLLAALCQATVDTETRATIVQRLEVHGFAEPDHQVILRAVAGIPPGEPGEMQQELTRAVTRLGFPDIELASLFSERAPTKNDVAALLEHL